MNVVKLARFNESNDMFIKDFLVEHMPKKVNKVFLDFKPKYKDKDFGYYQYQLLKCFEKIKKSVHLYGFEISKNQFELVIKRCKHLRDLHFNQCILQTEKNNLDSESETGKVPPIDYQINTLAFKNCTNPDGSDWGQNPSGFKSILEAIGPKDQ
mmetsp:Transcript_4991/g.4236  ORF Transcript_4991/g.4236 Transcript_4991/m.4236 type:complete len:154 (+) Transcript_4991:240-701(+)